ncbi:NeuD/PglB/VioB family sugar acetyltransferase [Arsenicicoccus dermatophilus]|uniref:NeuD/PglB/VioB family sugar acetyltransferase n=1 Tax=Arsenicicoccus dermatophilus TaxID=1076331 RepID=UPI0039171FF7
MSARGVVVVGAGGFGRETLDVLIAQGRTVIGVVDDAPSERNRQRLADRHLPHLGTLDAWLESVDASTEYVVGIGDGAIRERLAARLDAAGHRAATAIHPDTTIGSRVTIGPGTVILAGARLTTNITLHEHVHLNPNVAIGHDSELGPCTSANPAAVVAGEVRVGARVLLGTGSHVLQGLSVGDDTVVGACALVTKDVPSGVVVTGIPGRW